MSETATLSRWSWSFRYFALVVTVFAGLTSFTCLLFPGLWSCPDLMASFGRAFDLSYFWLGTWAAIAAVQCLALSAGGPFNILRLVMTPAALAYIGATASDFYPMRKSCDEFDWQDFLDNQGRLWAAMIAICVLTVLAMLVFKTVALAITEWRAR